MTTPSAAIQRKSLKTAASLVALASLLALSSSAEEPLRYKAQPRGSKVTVAGTSTIHDWTLEGEIIGGTVELPANVSFDTSKAELAGVAGGKFDAKADVSIPITSLKAPYDGMDEVMHQAINAADHPRIQFHLVEMTLKAPHTAGTPFAFDAKGDLIVNGVTNTITMPVTMENAEATKLKIVGKVPLKMTDFKITPPVKIGIFRTGDEITISYEWLVGLPKVK
jgi:polyisoprenoid-binding protein YceI